MKRKKRDYYQIAKNAYAQEHNLKGIIRLLILTNIVTFTALTIIVVWK
jgi:hypothetical protein